jgi:hypothetical protein
MEGEIEKFIYIYQIDHLPLSGMGGGTKASFTSM